MKRESIAIFWACLLLLLSGFSGVQASEEGRWSHKGWVQWHPHQGGGSLGHVGTQYFFSPADPIVNLPDRLDAEALGADDPMVPKPLDTDTYDVVADALPSDDSDGDGVSNGVDLCLNTPSGVPVNSQGCWVLGQIHFNFAKANILPDSFAELDRVLDILLANPDMRVALWGHTDNIGPETLNEDLSRRRAQAVLRYFEERGVPMGRMRGVGFGMRRPQTDNSTQEKRHKNRRVEIHPL
ncbi:MAG: OmpA family protein [Magnetococcales bacterium]|nr:OmpA family protein [Magnetococcales bacterium]